MTDSNFENLILCLSNKLNSEIKAAETMSEARKLDPELIKSLRDFTMDFTELAARGEIDPVIGRDSEIRRVLEILDHQVKWDYFSFCDLEFQVLYEFHYLGQ